MDIDGYTGNARPIATLSESRGASSFRTPQMLLFHLKRHCKGKLITDKNLDLQ